MKNWFAEIGTKRTFRKSQVVTDLFVQTCRMIDEKQVHNFNRKMWKEETNSLDLCVDGPIFKWTMERCGMVVWTGFM